VSNNDEAMSAAMLALGFNPGDPSMAAQFDVFVEALRVFEERNKVYNDNWKRQGYRGGLFKLRLKVERIWDTWWSGLPSAERSTDDILDAMNSAAFMYRSIKDGDRDGEWSYPS
jgi:hypothetical protein